MHNTKQAHVVHFLNNGYLYRLTEPRSPSQFAEVRQVWVLRLGTLACFSLHKIRCYIIISYHIISYFDSQVGLELKFVSWSVFAFIDCRTWILRSWGIPAQQDSCPCAGTPRWQFHPTTIFIPPNGKCHWCKYGMSGKHLCVRQNNTKPVHIIKIRWCG